MAADAAFFSGCLLSAVCCLLSSVCCLLTPKSLRTFYELLTPPLRKRAQALLMQQEKANSTPVGWEAFAAAVSFVGGILATLFGILLNVITWIVGAELHPWLRGISTALFVLTIPLLIFAGYCLDWMERKLASHPKKILGAASNQTEKGANE